MHFNNNVKVNFMFLIIIMIILYTKTCFESKFQRLFLIRRKIKIFLIS